MINAVNILNIYFNLLWPSDAIQLQGTWSFLVQVMACSLFGATPLPESILPYCQLDPWKQMQTSVKLKKKMHLKIISSMGSWSPNEFLWFDRILVLVLATRATCHIWPFIFWLTIIITVGISSWTWLLPFLNDFCGMPLQVILLKKSLQWRHISVIASPNKAMKYQQQYSLSDMNIYVLIMISITTRFQDH